MISISEDYEIPTIQLIIICRNHSIPGVVSSLIFQVSLRK